MKGEVRSRGKSKEKDEKSPVKEVPKGTPKLGSHRHSSGSDPEKKNEQQEEINKQTKQQTVERTYYLSSWIFIRFMGILYATAFVSTWIQIHGLIGSDGISPLPDLIIRLETSISGNSNFFTHPSIFWWNQSDDIIHLVCLIGTLCGVLLTLNILPLISAFICWFFYLSISSVGQTFFNQQWDLLLLESGFLLLFFVPRDLFSFFSKKLEETSPSNQIRWLFYCLLFRINFSRGILQLLGEEKSWRTLSTFAYFFETQPSPTPLSWYADKFPGVVQQGLVFWVLTIEIAIPLLIIGPQLLKRSACIYLISLQIFYIIFGNLGTYHWNIIALCILLLDDKFYLQTIRIFAPMKIRNSQFIKKIRNLSLIKKKNNWKKRISFIFTILILILSIVPILSLAQGKIVPPQQLIDVYRHTYPFKIVNIYTPFYCIYKDRYEIIVQGSLDAQNWKDYKSYFKPDLSLSSPTFHSPHISRLEYALWSAAQSDYQQEVWMSRLLHKMLDNSETVLKLFKTHPFSLSPEYVRAVRYKFSFTKNDGKNWWNAEFVDIFTPTFTRTTLEPNLKGKNVRDRMINS